MTDDQQDINSENVEQQEVSNKTKSSKTKTTIKSVFFLIFSFVVSFIIVDTMPFYKMESNYSDSYMKSSPLFRKDPFTDHLEYAASLYVAREKKRPKVFKDFLVVSGPVKKPVTLSLDCIDKPIDTIDGHISGVEKASSIAIKGFSGLNTRELLYSESKFGSSYSLNSFNFENPYVMPLESFKNHQKLIKLNILLNVIVYNVVILVFTLAFYFIFCLFNKHLKGIFGIIILILIYLFLFISLLTALGGQINSTVHKPAIYLYPTKPTNINVTIDKNIDLTLDIPKCKPDIGWNVLAYPDGKIVDLQPQYTNCNDLNSNRFGMEYAKEACDKNNYPYLYWEGIPRNKPLPAQTKGWIVKTDNSKAFLESKLNLVGFNKPEKDEFTRYWAHKILESKQDTVFISFMQTEAVNNDNSLTITPTPDSINRFYIVVDLNVKNHKNQPPQELVKFKRTGFTVVDWGGTIIGLKH